MENGLKKDAKKYVIETLKDYIKLLEKEQHTELDQLIVAHAIKMVKDYL